MISEPNESAPNITITYRGENGEGWVPKSLRDVWNYAVRTGQVIVPPLDDGGPTRWPAEEGGLDTGDTLEVDWIPPEYAGRLKSAPPPPQPAYFTLENDDE